MEKGLSLLKKKEIEDCQTILKNIRNRDINIIYCTVLDKKDIKKLFEQHAFNFADKKEIQNIIILDSGDKDDILLNELVKIYDDYHKNVEYEEKSKHQLSNMFFLSEILRNIVNNEMNAFIKSLEIIDISHKIFKEDYHIDNLDIDKLPRFNIRDILVRLYAFEVGDIIKIETAHGCHFRCVK